MPRESNSGPQSAHSFADSASIILIGCRGSGKKSLGFIAATHLKRRFVTEDYYFKHVTGLTRAECVLRHGSDEFYRCSMTVLSQMLSNHRTDCVIECGMGSLADEAQALLRKYKETNPIIYLMRNTRHIRNLLRLEESDARRLEIGDATHRTCSNFDYYNLYDTTGAIDANESNHSESNSNISFRLRQVKRDFCQFVDAILGPPAGNRNIWVSPFSISQVALEKRMFTHAIIILFSELIEGSLDLEELESGGDAIELVVDVWSAHMLPSLAKQIALLRRKVGLPIIFNATRFKAEVDRPTKEEYYRDLLIQGLRLRVDYLVISLADTDELYSQILPFTGRTKIIGELIANTYYSGGWLQAGRMSFYEKGITLGCDVIRLVQISTTFEETSGLKEFLLRIANPQRTSPPLIAYNLGPHDRESIIFNPILTPVSHPLLKSKSDYLTTKEVMQKLFSAASLDHLRHFVIGDTVSYSLSPTLHNAAYEACGLENTFEVREASSIEDARSLFQRADFGGASITHPLKVDLCTMLELKSYHAAVIGAVNCLLPLRAAKDGSTLPLEAQASQRSHIGPVIGWYGENVDWEAILTCIQQHLSPRNSIQLSKASSLVIGAGGVARAAIYALLILGMRKIFVYNRTISRAKELAKYYNDRIAGSGEGLRVIHVLKSLQDPWPMNCKPATIIISCIPAHSISGKSVADFEIPENWLMSPSGGVVLELAYEPVITPLLKQLKRFQRDTLKPWVLVDGIELLIEQASLQFELMTGRKAPRRHLRRQMEGICKEIGPRINDE